MSVAAHKQSGGLWRGVLNIGAQSGIAIAAAFFLIRGTLQPHPERLFSPIGLFFQAVLTIMDPFLGLLTWMVVSPFAPFWHLNLSLGAGVPDLGYNRLVFVLLALILFLQWATGRRPWPHFTWLAGWLLLFLIGYGLSIRLSVKGLIEAGQSFFDIWVLPLSLFFLVRFYVNSREQLRRALSILPLIAGYLVVLVLHEQTTGVIWFYPWGRAAQYTAHLHRMTGLLGDPAYHATILDVLMPYFLYRYFQATRAGQKWFYGTYIVLMSVAVGLLYTRAGYMGLLIVFVVWSIIEPRFRRPFFTFMALAGLSVLLLWGPLSRSALFKERLAQGETVGYRGKAFDIGIGYFLSSPLWGIGYANFGYRSLAAGLWYQYAPHWMPMPHDTYLDILLSAGLLGFLPLLGFWITLWRKIIAGCRWFNQHLPGERALWGIVVAATLAYMSIIATLDTGPNQFGNIVYFYLLGVLFAYLQAAEARRRQMIAWGKRQDDV